MIEICNNVHSKNMVTFAEDKPDVLVLSGDLTASCEITEFSTKLPEQFLSMGMAEQNMLSVAGGLAREGYEPYVHTFSVFLYRRPYDQLAMSIAYPNLKVRLIGFLPGIMTPGGVTHQAIEDVAVLRGLPNMTILETGDATEVESVLDVAHKVNGPVYIRMLRGQLPRLFPKDEPMIFNSARILSEGDDVTLITSGICTEESLRVTALLKEKGVGIQHLHISTLKPFTDPLVVEACKKARYAVITLENHVRIGGLGSAVAEVMADNGINSRLYRMGINDTFAQGAQKEFLMKKHGIDAISLLSKFEEVLGRTFGITQEHLGNVQLEQVENIDGSRLEAL